MNFERLDLNQLYTYGGITNPNFNAELSANQKNKNKKPNNADTANIEPLTLFIIIPNHANIKKDKI